MSVAFGPRPALRSGVKWLLIINLVVYLVALGYSYAVDFAPQPINRLIDLLALSNQGLAAGRVWQLVTHLFVHSLESPFHLVFNLLVLYWFGRDLEARWGTRRFLTCYGWFALGAVVASVLVGLVRDVPVVGASGPISGLLASFCILHWRRPLHLFFLQLTGRGWLIVFVLLDLVRLAAGDPVAVQAHWGGMIAAFIVLRGGQGSPRLLWLRYKRWRLKRRLRLERGGKANGDERYLH